MIFRWPWISAARHDEIVRMMGNAIGERDQRISQMEAERKILLDKISLLGIGAPIYAAMPGPVIEEKESKEPKPAPEPTPHRPSAIMRRMERFAERRWLRKQKPSDGNPSGSFFDKIDSEVRK